MQKSGLERAVLLLAAVAAALCFVAPARAEWAPRVEWRVANAAAPSSSLLAGEVLVNGQIVLRLRSELGGVLPMQRAEVAAERLRTAIAAGLRPADVRVDGATEKEFPRLKAGGQTIAVATQSEVEASGRAAAASPLSLARSWSAALRAALMVPGITVMTPTGGTVAGSERLVVPVGENRVLRLGGAARGPVDIATASGEAKIVRASVDPNTSEVMLSGAGLGRETITLTREGATTSVNVAVQAFAGLIDPTPRTVTVTGQRPLPGERLSGLVAQVAAQSARPHPGATVRLAAPSRLGALPARPGAQETVSVPITMEGPDLIPVQGTARVSVVNRRLPEAPTSHLMYSNHPERVTRFGTLFAARLSSHTGANRLLYHHQSNMTQAAVFVVELINDGDAPASVQVVGGAAGPVRDTVWVGYRAASIFVRDYLDDVGAVVDLPAGSRVAITCQRLAPELTISGLTRLRQLSGPRPVLVRVAADIPGDPRTAPGELAVTANPWAASAAVGSSAVPESPHVYAEPQKAIQARYDVGGLWAFVSVGKVPLRAVNGSETRLEGNYGVFYDVDFTLSNPTAKPANLRLTFEPAAGLAGGVFLVDGQFVEIPQTKGPEPSTLSRYTLAPGETRVVKVKTLPLSGSNYPIRLAVHP